MELRQLRCFAAVVEAGSISEGARRLHLSQPPLSLQMKQLEEELGVRLFDRGHKRIRLTEAGNVLYRRARALLELERDAAREVREAGERTFLRLGITPTTEPVLLPQLKELAGEYPALRFQIYDGTSFELLELLGRNVIELAALRSPVRAVGMEVQRIRREPMLAVWREGAVPAVEEPFALSSLAGLPLILYRRYRELIAGAFQSRGLAWDLLCECDEARTAVQWAAAGMGVALLPRSMASLCQGLTLRECPEADLETDILLLKREGNLLSEAGELLWSGAPQS